MTLSVQVVLTPTEAKRLLSKAVLQLDEVKKALDDGIMVVHPSSTTIFMLEELGLQLPKERIWVCGHISPTGLCLSRKQIDERKDNPNWTGAQYAFDLIFRKGKLLPHAESALGPVLDEMIDTDLYVKGVNAIDPDGKAGVLLAARSTGGSIGMVLQKQKVKKFKMIIPVGLEKRIPIPISQALAAAAKTQKAQGIPCGLWQLKGKVITEIEAFRLLCDVEAIPISAGGVCGAEGAFVWVLTGDEQKVEKAYNLCSQIHGHQLPYALDDYDCKDCPKDVCDFAGAKKGK
jgi:hypothetical protein